PPDSKCIGPNKAACRVVAGRSRSTNGVVSRGSSPRMTKLDVVTLVCASAHQRLLVGDHALASRKHLPLSAAVPIERFAVTDAFVGNLDQTEGPAGPFPFSDGAAVAGRPLLAN